MANDLSQLETKLTHTHLPPLEGKPTDNDLLAIRRTLLSLFMVIPYDQFGGIHSLVAILTEATKYKADHGNKNLSVPNASLSTTIPSPTMPRQSSKSVQRQPTNPTSMIMPVMRRPNVASPNS
jgi:hypothetical protein